MSPRTDRQTDFVAPAATALAAACLLSCWSPCAASEFAITVKTTTDAAITGHLVEFSLDQGLVLQPDDSEQVRHFPAGDVVQITTARQPRPAAPGLVRLELAGGDLLHGRLSGFAADVVLFDTETLGTVEVPLERIRHWRTPGANDPQRREALGALLEQRGDEDALLLTNGDVVRGLVTAMNPRGFVLETDGGESRIGHASIVAVVMVPTEPRPTNTTRVRILTTDGQRLTASRFEWSGLPARAVVFDSTELRLAGDRIARLDVLGGRWEWLAALEPISYQHTPALSLPWDWVFDRNVAGGPIRVAGQRFEHGLGVHSACSITFDLRGAYQEFVTSMGIDDDSGPYANVDVEIRVDGQLRFGQEGITPGRLHGPIRLDLSGAKRIKLSVLFGANADLQDRFDWVEAALIR